MMNDLLIQQNPAVLDKFESYPDSIRPKIEKLRALILEKANQIDSIQALEETLKWGEPSYLVKNGSTIRIDWKAKTPNQYAMYFKCTSKLVPTFKTLFGDVFKYEKNRAIVFQLEETIPETALQECIQMALTYHNIKNEL